MEIPWLNIIFYCTHYFMWHGILYLSNLSSNNIVSSTIIINAIKIIFVRYIFLLRFKIDVIYNNITTITYRKQKNGKLKFGSIIADLQETHQFTCGSVWERGTNSSLILFYSEKMHNKYFLNWNWYLRSELGMQAFVISF